MEYHPENQSTSSKPKEWWEEKYFEISLDNYPVNPEQLKGKKKGFICGFCTGLLCAATLICFHAILH